MKNLHLPGWFLKCKNYAKVETLIKQALSMTEHGKCLKNLHNYCAASFIFVQSVCHSAELLCVLLVHLQKLCPEYG